MRQSPQEDEPKFKERFIGNNNFLYAQQVQGLQLIGLLKLKRVKCVREVNSIIRTQLRAHKLDEPQTNFHPNAATTPRMHVIKTVSTATLSMTGKQNRTTWFHKCAHCHNTSRTYTTRKQSLFKSYSYFLLSVYQFAILSKLPKELNYRVFHRHHWLGHF